MGDDALTTVRSRYLAVNGDHEMTEADDLYVRQHFVPATDEQLQLMSNGLIPLPSYLLGDGTPMVPSDLDAAATIAGGHDRVHDWFVAFWPDDPRTAASEWRSYLNGQYVCLREVSPREIRRKNELVEQARAAVAALRDDPLDHVARGSLGEAVDGAVGVRGLDQLLLPMTAHDRLRFGGPTVRETWIDQVRVDFFSPQPPPLPLRTDRLVLREFVASDDAAFFDAWADEDWVRWDLTPPMNRAEVSDWARRRAEPSSTFLSLTIEHDGATVGEVSLHLDGTGLSSGDLGWSILPGHQGHGYGTEAARALIRIGFEHYGLHRLTANLDELNERSRAMCERLGMRLEQHAIEDFWSKGRWTSSYTYALLAREWRAGGSH